MSFKVNDKVNWLGMYGVVSCVTGPSEIYPIVVSFFNGDFGAFTADGKYKTSHRKKTLKLVALKPKKTINSKTVPVEA